MLKIYSPKTFWNCYNSKIIISQTECDFEWIETADFVSVLGVHIERVKFFQNKNDFSLSRLRHSFFHHHCQWLNAIDIDIIKYKISSNKIEAMHHKHSHSHSWRKK